MSALPLSRTLTNYLPPSTHTFRAATNTLLTKGRKHARDPLADITNTYHKKYRQTETWEEHVAKMNAVVAMPKTRNEATGMKPVVAMGNARLTPWSKKITETEEKQFTKPKEITTSVHVSAARTNEVEQTNKNTHDQRSNPQEIKKVPLMYADVVKRHTSLNKTTSSAISDTQRRLTSSSSSAASDKAANPHSHPLTTTIKKTDQVTVLTRGNNSSEFWSKHGQMMDYRKYQLQKIAPEDNKDQNDDFVMHESTASTTVRFTYSEAARNGLAADPQRSKSVIAAPLRALKTKCNAFTNDDLRRTIRLHREGAVMHTNFVFPNTPFVSRFDINKHRQPAVV